MESSSSLSVPVSESSGSETGGLNGPDDVPRAPPDSSSDNLSFCDSDKEALLVAAEATSATMTSSSSDRPSNHSLPVKPVCVP